MLHIATLIIAILVSQLARSAPTNALDANTLLQNGQAAQGLNTEFRRLNATDACTSGQTACISGALANCENDAWTIQQCLTSQRCFALPSVRGAGTFVMCTSIAKAQSVISATGATGGIFSTNSSSTADNIPFPFNNNTGSATPSDAGAATPSASDTSGNNNGVITITITTIVGGGTPTATTLSPEQATSLLSSLSADNAATATPADDASSSESPSASATITLENTTATPVPDIADPAFSTVTAPPTIQPTTTPAAALANTATPDPAYPY